MQKSKRKRAGAKSALILLSIFLFLFLISSTAFAETGSLGDVNEDGVVDVRDVVLVMRHVLEIEELDADLEKWADVNCDGVVNVQDATLIMQYSLGIIDEFPCDVDELDVNVSVTDKKTITVDFGKRIANPDDANITVKRMPSAHQTIAVAHISEHWTDNNRQVNLRRQVNYTPDNYLVTIEGLGLDKVHYQIKVERERVDKIIITSPNMVIDPDDHYRAIGHYRVYNQYGEDITSDRIASDLEWVTSLGAGTAYDNNRGKVTVDVPTWHTPFTVEDTIVLTVMDPSSGVKEKRTLGITGTMAIEDFVFGAVTPMPPPRDHIEIGWNPAARILIERAIDDDGVDRVTYGELQGQISLVSSNNNVYLYLKDKDYGTQPDKPAAIFVDTRDMTSGGNVTISVIINATGERFTKTIRVEREPYPTGITIGLVEDGRTDGNVSNIIAGKRPNKPWTADTDIYLPLTIIDQFGNERTAWQIAADYDEGKFELESNNQSVIATGELSIETRFLHPYRGYLRIGQVGEEGYADIRVSLKDNGFETDDVKEIKVSAPREPDRIYLPRLITRVTPPYLPMTQGTTRNFQFFFLDQYGDSYTAIAQDNLNYWVNVTIERYSGEENTLSINPSGREDLTLAQSEDRYTLTAAPDKTGVFRIRGVLKESDGSGGKDLYEAKTYVEVVEERIYRLVNLSATDLRGDESGQDQEFRFTLDGTMGRGEYIIMEIPDSEGISYSTDEDDYEVSGAGLEIISIDHDRGRDPEITFRTTADIPHDREVIIETVNVNTAGIRNKTIAVEFTRKDHEESAVTFFNVGN